MPLYVPPHNRETDPAALHALMAAHPLATLVSAGADGPEATHVPLLFDPEAGAHGTLVGHMARANGHWRHIETYPDVLAIFHGPQAFVSAAWYGPPTGISTWNYAVVHARGRARLIHDAEGLHALLSRIRAGFDAPETQALPYAEKLVGAIVGIEITVESLDGRFKLEQRESAENQTRVRARLAEGDAEAQRVAAMMAEREGQSGKQAKAG